MSKNTQTAPIEATEAQGAAVAPPGSELVCLVQLQVAAVYNGHSYPSGTTIGGVPYAIAKKMESFHTARIIGAPARAIASRARDLSAIENRIPGNLGLDPSQWEPACPIVGQRSSVFINTAELDAFRNR